MVKKVRMAVLGVGPRALGLTHTYLKHPNIEFVALCDNAKGVAESAAMELKKKISTDLKTFTSYEDLVKGSTFDALFIACDPDIQVDYACDAMNRGIHVMTEVPAAYTIEQCWNLVKTVEKTGAKYQLAEQTRYWKFIREWRDMAGKGFFGKIIYAEGEYLHYEPAWDYFVNIHTGQHVASKDLEYRQYNTNPDYKRSWRYKTFYHPIYYLPHTLSPLLSITGGCITKVSCIGTKRDSYTTIGLEARDLETALMYNSNDVIFSVRAGFTSPHAPKKGTGAHWYQIKGVEGSVEWSRSTIDKPKSWSIKGGWLEHDWTLEDMDSPDYIRNSSHGGSDWYPIDYFVDSIINDKVPPMDVYKAVETAAPAILAAKSSEEGGKLMEVPDFRGKDFAEDKGDGRGVI